MQLFGWYVYARFKRCLERGQGHPDNLPMEKHGIDPDSKEVRSQGAAIRNYYLTRDQIRIVNGVLYYEWIDDGDIRSLRLIVPKH